MFVSRFPQAFTSMRSPIRSIHLLPPFPRPHRHSAASLLFSLGHYIISCVALVEHTAEGFCPLSEGRPATQIPLSLGTQLRKTASLVHKLFAGTTQTRPLLQSPNILAGWTGSNLIKSQGPRAPRQ
ncbi:hypothetical protein LY78DRAFT_362492 [Colletotrichum sublineola]|nr:hypothetical protein LY78DRAFT_362492 [Colletotrichum sublineola]